MLRGCEGVECRHLRNSTLVVSAERESSESSLLHNNEILVIRACFQVSLTEFPFFFSNKIEVDFWQVCSHVLRVFTCHGAETLLEFSTFVD